MQFIHTSNQTWDPATRVSLPRTAVLQITHRHGGLILGVASRDDKGYNPEDDEVGYFVGSEFLLGWFRIMRADYEVLLARLRADPSGEVGLEHKSKTLTFTFGNETRLEVRHHPFTDAEEEDDQLRRRAAG